MTQSPGHSHVHGHGHAHSPASAHPPQRLGWSILRMTLAQRLGVVFVAGAGLWAVILLALK